MTRLVAALEARGLIVREGDPADARLTRVRATARGKALLARGRARRVEVLARALAELPEEELAALGRSAGTVAEIVRRLPA
jgi:DNA-binding MarR family transcriptional regulator